MVATETSTRVAEQGLIELLNEIINVEYGALFFLPQYLAHAPSQAAWQALVSLGQEELHHFELTMGLLRRAGGRLTGDLPAMHPEPDLETLLSRQARREMMAVELYKRAQEAARAEKLQGLPADELVATFERLEATEHRHLDLIKRVLKEIQHG